MDRIVHPGTWYKSAHYCSTVCFWLWEDIAYWLSGFLLWLLLSSCIQCVQSHLWYLYYHYPSHLFPSTRKYWFHTLHSHIMLICFSTWKVQYILYSSCAFFNTELSIFDIMAIIMILWKPDNRWCYMWGCLSFKRKREIGTVEGAEAAEEVQMGMSQTVRPGSTTWVSRSSGEELLQSLPSHLIPSLCPTLPCLSPVFLLLWNASTWTHPLVQAASLAKKWCWMFWIGP